MLTVALCQTVGALVALLDKPTRTAALPGDTAPDSAMAVSTVDIAGTAFRLMLGGMMVKLLEMPMTAMLP